MFGWGLSTVGFPLYAVHYLHASSSDSGLLWAAVALGSAVGTFALPGPVALWRVGLSYLALGLSALLWPLAGTVALGIVLVGFTGFLEGPAYSGSIAIRQRRSPPAARAALLSAINAFTLAGSAAGAAVAGWLGAAGPVLTAFTLANIAAGALCLARGRGGVRSGRGGVRRRRGRGEVPARAGAARAGPAAGRYSGTR
jgi:MFS family permease